MGVVNNGVYENVLDRSAVSRVRESPSYTRSFTVRVDDPNTPLWQVTAAPGISYGSPHPQDPTVYVTGIDVTPEGSSMLLYKVTFEYGIVDSPDVSGGSSQPPKPDGTPDYTPPAINQIPVDSWTGSSNFYSTSVSTCTDGSPIKNTAGVIIPGIQREKVETSLNLLMHFKESDLKWVLKLGGLLGMVNANIWPLVNDEEKSDNLGLPGEWRFSAFSWNWKQQQVYDTPDSGVPATAKITYYECNVTLTRRKGIPFDDQRMKYIGATPDYDPGWSEAIVSPWLPWIVSQGYTELKNGKRYPIMQDIEYKNCSGADVSPPDNDPNSPCDWPTEEPVSDPQPLDLDGKQVQAGQEAALLLPNILPRYKQADDTYNYAINFDYYFGNPLSPNTRQYYPQNTSS